ncbi:MAG: phosphonate C-P lyase system protein PhnG [Proteobacteria bacterium]|nr:phosphonate C-P lyase system protein PhnG [Pseudomonadota bacterium]
MSPSRHTAPDHAARRHWLGVLARAGEAALETAWQGLAQHPVHSWVRRPESGMTMVRGRANGSGAPFNLGEMTVTRCALRLDDGIMGVAYVQGRSHRHAELAALFDALLQRPSETAHLQRSVIAPLERERVQAGEAARRRTAATRVEFFTMATGREAR